MREVHWELTQTQYRKLQRRVAGEGFQQWQLRAPQGWLVKREQGKFPIPALVHIEMFFGAKEETPQESTLVFGELLLPQYNLRAQNHTHRSRSRGSNRDLKYRTREARRLRKTTLLRPSAAYNRTGTWLFELVGPG